MCYFLHEVFVLWCVFFEKSIVRYEFNVKYEPEKNCFLSAVSIDSAKEKHTHTQTHKAKFAGQMLVYTE